MYVRLYENKAVELIPDIAPEFPGFSIQERYTEEFLRMCVHVDDGVVACLGMIYDAETGIFSEPVLEEEQEVAE